MVKVMKERKEILNRGFEWGKVCNFFSIESGVGFFWYAFEMKFLQSWCRS